MPVNGQLGVDSVAAEAHALSSTVGLRVLRDTAVLRVTGDDARSWLNGQLTNDLSRTRRGDVTYAFFLNGSGHIVADVWALDRGGEFDLLLPHAKLDALVAYLEERVIMEDVTLERDLGKTVLTMQGPLARDIATTFPTEPDRVWPCDRLGRGGLDLLVSRGEAEQVLATVLEAARRRGGLEVSEQGWELGRIRLGRPQFGVDFDERDLPQETGLKASAISFQKGCYLGQEAVVMLEHRGKLPKQMVTFEVATETPVPRDTPVLANGDARVGRITSSVLDPETPGRVPALGYVKRRYIDEGRTLRVGAFDARIVHVVGANAEAPV